MPYPLEHDYYAAIAANLLAGDIQARVVANDVAMSIEIALVDGSRVLWSNALTRVWTYTIIPDSADAEMHNDTTRLDWKAMPDEVSKYIALFEYPAPAVYPYPGA